MGEIAIVSALIERSDDTIVLPKTLVHSYAGRHYVNILNSKGLREERYVSLGIATSSQVEITEGLQEGELVVIN
jgi:macrolide-specific efflux system membrane fusion protein